ncbi:low molecular weight protein-tyrosine-phosphatase [Fibrobacter sp. UWB10]|uniref:low molecular weight protein-tyrosine-phosphatase n=1 Tax=Fibrobacter sp. UWB10 TaxID=1896201 RepID=UPI002402F7AF|nr:low molecular weight protein-tyrosine-phosphatase [Fibrobacter sp. UWB10]SMP57814.1 protein-tyrosine phosphatase [Fibrobacter sp. UWB10]
MKIKILFVCHGNICRSPMAEFVMKKLVRDLPAESLADVEFEIASAATSTEEIGNPVYPPARRMLASHGIDCSGKTARQMTVRDYEYYDYIVLMDRNNLRNLRWILPPELQKDPNHKISLLMDWVGKSRDVADPWYTGDFQATWDDVNEGCKAMLAQILR